MPFEVGDYVNILIEDNRVGIITRILPWNAYPFHVTYLDNHCTNVYVEEELKVIEIPKKPPSKFQQFQQRIK